MLDDYELKVVDLFKKEDEDDQEFDYCEKINGFLAPEACGIPDS